MNRLIPNSLKKVYIRRWCRGNLSVSDFLHLVSSLVIWRFVSSFMLSISSSVFNTRTPLVAATLSLTVVRPRIVTVEPLSQTTPFFNACKHLPSTFLCCSRHNGLHKLSTREKYPKLFLRQA